MMTIRPVFVTAACAATLFGLWQRDILSGLFMWLFLLTLVTLKEPL